MTSEETVPVPLTMPDQSTVYVEAQLLDPEQDVALVPRAFDKLANTIGTLAESLHSVVRTTDPDRVVIEVSLSAAIDAGELVAILVRGGANANMKLTFEWQRPTPALSSD